ncbi:MAG: hypothetical protein ABR591_15655 [Candidatus Velthaea sp.]
MYVSPQIIASFQAAELLGDAYGDRDYCDDKYTGNGSCDVMS